jgi:hypothetical protein
MKKVFLLAAMFGLITVSNASAATLIISSTSFDIAYDGNTTLSDSNPIGGSGNPSDADSVASMSFTVPPNNAFLVLTSNIWIDMSLTINTPLVYNTASNITGGYFHLLTGTGNPAWGLALNVTGGTVTVYQNNLTVTLLAQGGATLCNTCSPNNTLPIDGPFTITFSSQGITPIAPTSNSVGAFTANGSADVTGTFVPEPSTYAMLGTALLGLGYLRRRK